MDDEQSLLNEPAEETAAQAFARLDGRIAMMTRAVEHLAAERASIDIPDYSATLGQMNTRLAAVAQALAGIAEKPAMLLTPEALAARMDAAAETSRATDRATLREAREAHQEAARIIHSLVGVISGASAQRRHLIWVASGGLAAGCLLWSIMPGVILRALPASWHMPESLAAYIIGEPTLWDAGIRMMHADDPDAWSAITAVAEMRHDNQEVITTCERDAVKAKRPVRCTIKVGHKPTMGPRPSSGSRPPFIARCSWNRTRKSISSAGSNTICGHPVIAARHDLLIASRRGLCARLL